MKQVLLLSRDGQFIRRISGNGIGLGEYTSFWDATLDEAGDFYDKVTSSETSR